MNYLKSNEQAKPVTLGELARMREAGEKVAVLTCYDASFASLLNRSGVDVLLVGDSLGNVIQGQTSTLPVTLDEMAYHTACVARGLRASSDARAMLVTDMPFGSYQESPAQAMRNAAKLMAAGAAMVKIEGGLHMTDTVRFLVERGVPVCAHIGLTPQSVHQLGGYRVQGKTDEAASRMKAEARALEEAGATMLVLEMVPSKLAGEITHATEAMLTIGIGAGPDCAGQVLVIYDMLGIYPGKKARFVKNFMEGAADIESAIRAYVSAVKDGRFPAPEHTF